VHRSFSDKWLVAKTVVLLGITRLMLNTYSWQRLQKVLGAQMQETPAQVPSEHEAFAKRIRWAVTGVSPHLPFRSDCFPQALTTKMLLKRAGIPSTLYMGAAFKPDEAALGAHVWLRCGETFVGGRRSASDFGAVSFFGA